MLLTRRQKESETTTDYLLALRALAKECAFEPVDAIKNREHYIRDSFVAGLCDKEITQKILESSETELDKIATLSQVYEDAKKNTEKFKSPHVTALSCALAEKSEDPDPVLAAASSKDSYSNSNYNNYRSNKDQTCGWCGKERHAKFRCPARDHVCKKCTILGHYEKVCRSFRFKKTNAAAATFPFIASLSSVPKKEPTCLEPSTFNVGINRYTVNALWDTGSAENYIHPDAVKKCKLEIVPEEEKLKLLSENTDGISEDNCKNLKDTNSRMNLKPQHTVSSPWHSVDKTSEQVSIPKHRSANPPNNLFIPKSTSGASGAFPDKYGSLDRLLKVSDYIQKSPDKRRHSLNSPSAIAANTTNTEQKALLEYEIPNNKLNTYITH